MFAKTPEPGSVKTRLQPILGEEGCYRLHRFLVSYTLKTACETNLANVELWHTGSPEQSFWQEQCEKYSLALREQKGADLGERMLHAFEDALDKSVQHSSSSNVDWAILIGSDCPEINLGYLREAADLLESGKSVVIGPALDGGYVLIGLREPKGFLFHGIQWGASSVLEETLAIASQHHCDVHLMHPLRDLDVEEDLTYFRGTVPFF